MAEPREPENFYLLWITRTFSGPWGIAGLAGSILSLAVPAAIKYVPGLQRYGPRMNDMLWQAPLLVFLALAVVRFFIAPWSIHRDERKRAEAVTARLLPAVNVRYDSENSLFEFPCETYRLRVINLGVRSVTGVWVRVVSIPTAPHLKGVLPVALRQQHGGGAPFILNHDAALFIDVLEADNGPITVTGSVDGQTQASSQTMLVYLCSDASTPQLALVVGSTAHIIEIEVQGIDVPVCRKKLNVQLLSASAKAEVGSWLQISEA